MANSKAEVTDKQIAENIKKYGIKHPTMLSVSAQQAESFLELLEYNKDYGARILVDTHFAENLDEGRESIENDIEELRAVIKRITDDLGLMV